MTTSFKELEEICKAKGLTLNARGNVRLWKGNIDGRYARVCLHVHAFGRDIPNGTLNQYVKELGFNNLNELKEFYDSI